MDTNATLPIDYQGKLIQLSQAILYVYNEAGEKLAAGIVRGFTFDAEGNIDFTISSLPMIASNWHSYAAELYCYKKGVPYNLQLSGTVLIASYETLSLKFIIHQIDYCGEEDKLAKNTYLGKWNFWRYLLPNHQQQTEHHYFKLS